MNLVKKSTKRKNHNQNFIKRTNSLIEYFKQNGTIANIKQTDTFVVNGKEVKIGWLITNLRQDKRKGLLQDTDVTFLEYLGMDWGDVLAQYLEVLDNYFKENLTLSDLTQYSGNFKYNDKIVNLGTVVQYIRKTNELTQEQIELLEKRGLIIKPKSVENVLQPIKLYYEEHGTIANIRNHDSVSIEGKTYNIGRTIGYFRLKYNKGRLKQKYIDELNAMGMRWSAKEQAENLVDI